MTQSLEEIWWAGVNAVRGAAAVSAALPNVHAPVHRILAIGKAACDMAAPAMHAFPDAPTLVVTKHGHGTDLPHAAEVIEAGHPIPDGQSLRGGATLADAVAACAPGDHLLVLVSGGASAVAELLPEEMTLEDWQETTRALVASGADIHAINTHRRAVSRIKGGKLLQDCAAARVTTLAISDVEGDDLLAIGSGIGAATPSHSFEFRADIVASNQIARQAAAAVAIDPIVANEECLYDNVTALAPRLGERLRAGPSGLYIFGGEPTVVLPENPGRGGRNQALALMMAKEIAGRDDIEILVAGTDGTDGPTGDAGGWVDGKTWGPGTADALARADAGTYLAAHDALLTSGPTGTNVMDVMIARKA